MVNISNTTSTAAAAAAATCQADEAVVGSVVGGSGDDDSDNDDDDDFDVVATMFSNISFKSPDFDHIIGPHSSYPTLQDEGVLNLNVDGSWRCCCFCWS